MHFVNPHLSRSTAMVVGVLAVVLGIMCVVWPGISIGVLAVLFALFCFGDAAMLIERVVHSSAARNPFVAGLLAAVDVVAGILVLAWPGIAAETLALLVGLWWIVSGAVEIGMTFTQPGHRLSFLFAGLLSLAAGLVLVAWPGLGALAIALIFGFVLLFRGCGLLAMAWRAQGDGSISGVFAGGKRATAH